MSDEAFAIVARALEWAVFAGALVVPLVMLFVLWRMRRGIARCGVVGFLVRWLGGGVVLTAIAWCAAVAYLPALKLSIEACQARERAGEYGLFCEDEGIAVALVFIGYMIFAVAWAVLMPLAKAGAIAWRLSRPSAAA